MVEEFSARRALCSQTVSALVSGPWTGAGASTFHEGWVAWAEGAAEISAALSGISALLSEASVQYAETEAHVTRASDSSQVVFVPGGVR